MNQLFSNIVNAVLWKLSSHNPEKLLRKTACNKSKLNYILTNTSAIESKSVQKLIPKLKTTIVRQ